MRPRRAVLLGAAGWLGAISAAHWALNLRSNGRAAGRSGGAAPFRVGFLPVTCHLTCPVTDFINRQLSGESHFQPIRFSGWPELKEAFLARHTEATFILAPMAMALREQGVPIKIVYLGHRDGTAMVVHKDSTIHSIDDLRGKKVAVPNRYSNQRLLLFKALADRGVALSDVSTVEMAPPDMPAALYARAVDAITSGEPFMGQAELDGYGRVLYLTKDVWPNFISCVLAVHQDIIAHRRAVVAELVKGIAQSGLWLESSMDRRMQAAQFVSKNYYNQDPRLLAFVLSKPPDRVRYGDLGLRRPDFLEIERLGIAAGILTGKATFEDYTDASFSREVSALRPFSWDGGRGRPRVATP